MQMNVDSIAQKTREMKDQGFGSFLNQPATRLLLSMIPPAENPDVLQTLLKECFESGHDNGSMTVIMTMVEKIFKEKPQT